MARRATYFFDVHKTTAPRILVAGAWEYVRPGSQPASADTLASISRALGVMKYDVGLLSAEESDILNQLDVKVPSWQQTAAATPFTAVQTSAGDMIGFLRLPALTQGHSTPSDEFIESITRQIEKYRDKVRLLIGLSEWGWLAEQEYLSKNPRVVPDILLGSGRGSGVNGRILDDRCLWMRAYDKGRSIAEITIYEWPVRKNSFAWNPSKNYKTSSIGLNDSYKDHPAVNAVIE